MKNANNTSAQTPGNQHAPLAGMRCMVCAQHFGDANALFAHMNAAHSGGVTVGGSVGVIGNTSGQQNSAGSGSGTASSCSDDDAVSPADEEMEEEQEEDEEDGDDDDEDEVGCLRIAEDMDDIEIDEELAFMNAVNNGGSSDAAASPPSEDSENDDDIDDDEDTNALTIVESDGEVNADGAANETGASGDDDDEDDSNTMDYSNFEYSSTLMEPICELVHKDDDGDAAPTGAPTVCPITQLQAKLHQHSMQQTVQKLQIQHQLQQHEQELHALLRMHNAQSAIVNGGTAGGGPLLPIKMRPAESPTSAAPAAGQPLFQCRLCDQSFDVAGDLARHVRSHTLNKPFQCSICDKQFTHIGSLNTHLRIHSGEKPYKCTKCTKAFTQSSSLMVHLRSHQTVKQYQCSVCEKGFVNHVSLLAHQRQHEQGHPFPCTECDIGFKQAHLLEEHMAVHRNVNMYQCSICR